MLTITSLGGSGEDSRNCFLIESDTTALLLDCGVRREIAEVSRVYPLLTEEIARKLDAALLSHAHEDHTAALPYLYELGYRGPVYASPETIGMTPAFMRKWADYVKKNGGTLPFHEENIEKIRFLPVDQCPIPLTCGRDGHIIGGLWYRFELEGRSILYTGDLTRDSLLLETDPLPEAEILIIDSAYAGKRLVQDEQYGHLAETARRVTAAGGKLLLPVPVNGRGIDMFVFLSRFGLPLYAETNLLKSAADLAGRESWIKPFAVPSGNFTAVSDENRAAVLQPDRSGVYLFGDGMMTSPVSKEYYDAVRDDSHSRIIISGHSAKGTLANQLLDTGFRRENGIAASVEQLTIKVHNDEEDVLELADRVQPKYVILFHAKSSACGSLAARLSARGLTVLRSVGQPLTV